MRSRLLPLAAVCCTFAHLSCSWLRLEPAANSSVAGARATLVAYVAAVIAGNGTTACSLPIRKQLAKADHQSSCETVIETAAELLKSRPTQAAQFRSYASTDGRTFDYLHAPFAAAAEPPIAKEAFYTPLEQLRLPEHVRFIAGFLHEKLDCAHTKSCSVESRVC